MKKKVESFAREILLNPVRIVVGAIGEANPDIKQVVQVVGSPDSKYNWLITHVDEWLNEGKLLIFVNAKQETEDLSQNLKRYFADVRGLDVGGIECIHGDLRLTPPAAMRKSQLTAGK